MIDLCIVTCLRPEILEKTLNSFCENVVYDDRINIIVHIDYVPKCNIIINRDHGIDPRVDLEIAKFRTLLNIEKWPVYICGTGNFASAVKDTWKYTKSDYVFHLEDDWRFINSINLNECINIMKTLDSDYMRFPKKNAPLLDKVALQPSLWRGSVVRELSKHMVTNKDPEKQLRVGSTNKNIDRIISSIEMIDWDGGPYCEDIGREWREERNLVKWNKNKDKNITWSKLDD